MDVHYGYAGGRGPNGREGLLMRRASAGILVAVLLFAGCKSADSKRNDREPIGQAAARKGKEKDATPKWLDPIAKLPGAGTGVPKAPSWGSDPANPNFNAKSESQDAVGGRVLDSFGRPAKNVFIRVDSVTTPAGGSGNGGLGIMTDQNGYFFTRGLKPGQSYNLTAEATQEGKPLAGSVQTQVPNPVITIVLREDLGVPPGGGAAPKPAEDAFPPPPAELDRIPAAGLGNPHTPRPGSNDGAFVPGAGANRPVPANIGNSPVPSVRPSTGNGGAPPPPDDLSDPKPSRPENVAGGEGNRFTPPPVSIPGPPALPPALPNPGTPGPKQSRIRPGANFALVDTLDRNWDFATDRSGSVVLLEFVTTNCPNCKPAVPVLKDLQSRYGASGLQVIAVLCDEAPQKARTAAAARYARDNNTNYAVYAEPGASAGSVRDHYGVDGYPTAVLLDATGAVLWKGHPAKRAEIENAVKRALGR